MTGERLPWKQVEQVASDRLQQTCDLPLATCNLLGSSDADAKPSVEQDGEDCDDHAQHRPIQPGKVNVPPDGTGVAAADAAYGKGHAQGVAGSQDADDQRD